MYEVKLPFTVVIYSKLTVGVLTNADTVIVIVMR